MTRDITPRKRKEEDLARSEANLLALFRGIPLPSCIWRREGDDILLVDGNDAAAEVTGGGSRACWARD